MPKNRMENAGMRIGAHVTLSGAPTSYFLGLGTHEGDHPCPFFKALRYMPRLKMDSGETLWGNEVWWGPESNYLAADKDPRIPKFKTIADAVAQSKLDIAGIIPPVAAVWKIPVAPTANTNATVKQSRRGVDVMTPLGTRPDFAAASAAWEATDGPFEEGSDEQFAVYITQESFIPEDENYLFSRIDSGAETRWHFWSTGGQGEDGEGMLMHSVLEILSDPARANLAGVLRIEG